MSVADTFNRADSASTLGTTSDGLAVWSAASGTWGISTNQAYSPSIGAAPGSVALIDSLTADGTVQVTIAADHLNAGLVFRAVDAGTFWVAQGSQLLQLSGGSFTGTSFAISPVPANGDVLAAVLAGTSIVIKVNGTTACTATSSFSLTATKHGLLTPTTSGRFDDYSAPLVVTASARHRPVVITSAVTRAAVR